MFESWTRDLHRWRADAIEDLAWLVARLRLLKRLDRSANRAFHELLHGLFRSGGNLLRLLTISAFPLGALVVLGFGLGWAEQGKDIVLLAIEQRAHGSNYLLRALWIGSGVLGLSIWFTLRILLGVRYPQFAMSFRPGGLVRTWFPRLSGAAAPLLVGLILSRFAGAGPWPAAFLVQAAGILLFTVLRRVAINVLHEQRTGHAPPVGLPPPRAVQATLLKVSFWAGLTTFGLLFVFVAMPVNAPRVFGSAALVTVALASINFFGSLGLTHWPMALRLPPLAMPVLALTAAFSPFNDNHAGRAADAPGAALPLERVTPRYQAWQAAHGRTPSSAYAVVAAEGGGIRAGYWTAAVLDELERQVPGFRDRVFALSGVSGGSVGAAAWWVAGEGAAAHRQAPADCAALAGLERDLLSPAVAGLLFYDLMQRFLPVGFAALDRSRALETGLSQAFADCAGRPMDATLATLYAGRPGEPSLLLNATITASGSRAVLSNLSSADFTDVPELMAPACSTALQPLAGQVHHSARFPVVSPAGRIDQRGTDALCGERFRPESPLEMARATQKSVESVRPVDGEPAVRLVDGGYFENGGLTTAIEVIRAIESPARDPEAADGAAMPSATSLVAPRPLLLVLRNDPAAPPLCRTGPEAGRQCCRLDALEAAPPPAALVRPGDFMHETMSMVGAFYNTRAAHARLAAHAALVEVAGDEGLVCDLRIRDEGFVPPLGWSLSRTATTVMRAQAKTAVAGIAAEVERLFDAPATDQ